MILRSELETHLHGMLATVAGIVGCKVAHKNIPFTPDAKVPYLRASIFVGEKYPITCGDDGHLEFGGFYQIDIRTPKSQGTTFQNNVIDLVNQHFKIGKHLNIKADHYFKLKSIAYGTGGQTTVSDATRGSVEDLWDVNYITVNWLAREPK